MITQITEIVREASLLMKKDIEDISQKGNASNYVTSADIAVQDFLYEKLRALLPGSGFIGEEGDAAYQTAEYTWVIDPIDGTSNFIRDLG